MRALSLGMALFILWMLLSGTTDPLLVSLGIASSILCVLIARRMDVIDHEGHPIHLSWRVAVYWPWLLWEILKANLEVARAILSARAVQPRLMRLKGSQKSELGHVIYANSITLTPGTVTIALDDGSLEIHALTDGSAKGLGSGDMDRRVTRLEGTAPKTGPRTQPRTGKGD